MSIEKPSSKPSPTELALLKALWKQAPLTAKEIHQRVEDKLQWSYSSTRKTLERMTDKGFLSVQEVHGIRVFLPAISKVGTLATYIKDLTRSVLEVDGALPVSMFADSKLLDDNELKELEKLLSEQKHDE